MEEIQNTGKLKRRDEVEEGVQWDLNDLFNSEEAFEEAFQKAKEEIKAFRGLKGTVGVSKEAFLDSIKAYESLDRLIGRVYAYAYLHKDEDLANVKYQGLADRAIGLITSYGEAVSFYVPEILEIPEETVSTWLKEKDMALYRHFFEDIFRTKAHTLTKEMEELLAGMGEVLNAPEHIYDIFTSADMEFPEVTNEKGEKVELSEGTFSLFRSTEDREVRKNAFEALFKTYLRYQNTMAMTLAGNTKKNVAVAKARKYENTRQWALDGNHIPESVYDNMIKTIHDRIEPLHRYTALRKKVLGLDEVHPYDLYVPLVKEVKFDIPFEEGKKMVLEGLRPMGEEYLSILKKGLDSRWIDVYPNKGKQSGAYSFGNYDVHPYVLLNYNNDLDDVMTLAHEMGHALHSYYSSKNQPYIYSDYSIFCAEVASTTNEALMNHYLLKTITEKEKRKYLLNHYMEQIRTTIYRQCLFAEFEAKIHRYAEEGMPLTSALLNKEWGELYRFYYGKDLVVDDWFTIEWARIPHFYMNFYVFQYVTGMSAGIAFKDRIVQGEAMRDQYLGFLKSGSHAYSLDILKKAGVDMNTPEPILSALNTFEELLSELESLL